MSWGGNLQSKPAEGFWSHARPLGRTNHPALVAVNVNCRRLDQQEVLVGLQQEGHAALLQVEDDRGVPVLGGVHVALGGGGNHQVAVAEACLDDPISKLQLLPSFVCHVAEADSFPSRHSCLN